MGQVSNKGTVTFLYSSSWMFNQSIKETNSGNVDQINKRFKVDMKAVLKCSRILTKEWQALELGTLKELEHIMPSLLNAKHTSLAEIVIMRVDQRHGKIFIPSFSITRHMVTKEVILGRKIRIISSFI